MTEFEPQIVSADDLPEYPFGNDDTLETHFFIALRHREWLNGDMRLRGLEECRALYFDLICICQDQKPIGTLPAEPEVLAKLLLIDVARFKRLCEGKYGVLHRWEPCLCGDQVRLMHPDVVERLVEAFSRKADNRARNDAANASKRRLRLRNTVGGFHADLAQNAGAILWMDDWLVAQGVQYRDADQIQRAIAAWTHHTFTGKPRGPG